MKDKEGVDLVEGDLVMVTIKTPTQNPAFLAIFLNYEEYVYKITVNEEEVSRTTNTLHYYPITDDGLEVAKFDNGVNQPKMHREQKFTLTNIKAEDLLKMDPLKLRGYQKTLYDSIIALL